MKFIELSGRKFGRLTVEKKELGKGKSRWFCRCDCGSTAIIYGENLTRGLTSSCGCLQKERASASSHKHGACESRAYTIWCGIKARCLNPKSTRYKYYGGRGITMCDRWLAFQAFLEDMGHPADNCSIDRINNNEGYSKENCRWATQKEQTRNTRRNRYIEIRGESKCIAAWSDEFGIQPDTIVMRMKRGWSPERAVLTPLKQLTN